MGKLVNVDEGGVRGECLKYKKLVMPILTVFEKTVFFPHHTTRIANYNIIIILSEHLTC